jgi:hypothetical protein
VGEGTSLVGIGASCESSECSISLRDDAEGHGPDAPPPRTLFSDCL